jgi:hypothetical protein
MYAQITKEKGKKERKNKRTDGGETGHTQVKHSAGQVW